MCLSSLSTYLVYFTASLRGAHSSQELWRNPCSESEQDRSAPWMQLLHDQETVTLQPETLDLVVKIQIHCQ
jgi:hypothetical protein